MKIKGFLRLCAGVIGAGVLTFQDSQVSPAVSLLKLTEDHHAGFMFLHENKSIEIDNDKVSVNTKYEKQGGFIKHTGFIKGCA